MIAVVSVPHTTAAVCSPDAMSRHSMRVALWFDIRIRVSGGSTVEVCAAVSVGVDGDTHHDRYQYERHHGAAVDVQTGQPIRNMGLSHL